MSHVDGVIDDLSTPTSNGTATSTTFACTYGPACQGPGGADCLTVCGF